MTPSSLEQKRERLAGHLRRAAERSSCRPLSSAQQRLWFLDQLEPNSPLYNVPVVVRLRGNLDAGVLGRAVRSVGVRHETLRSRFPSQDGLPVQLIDPVTQFEWRTLDLAHLPEPQREAEANRLLREAAIRPFELAGPQHLIRAVLIRLGSNEHRLLMVLHHIIADEWSLKVLFRELVQFYQAELGGREAILAELPIQYSDYAHWQRGWLEEPAYARQLAFWKNQLSQLPPVTELPADRPRKPTPTFRGGIESRGLEPQLGATLAHVARDHEASLFMGLLAALNTLLLRYTSQEDLIVASPLAGRNRVETEGLIGLFVNTLPLRCSLAGDPTFEELIERVRAVTLKAYSHQDVPFEKLVEAARPERSLNHLPFTRIMFSVQDSLPAPIELPGLKFEFSEVDTGTSKFDLTFLLRETESGLWARIEYNSDLFDAGTIARLLNNFETLLGGIVADPKRRLSMLPLLNPDERRQVLVEWNRTRTEYPRTQCIHELFSEQASLTPDARAVVYGEASLTYGELNAQAERLAQRLRGFRFVPGAPIALCVDRSPAMASGTLGILKAGGAYLPLDPTYPEERLRFMLDDSRSPVVVTQRHLLSRLPRGFRRVVCLDALESREGFEVKDAGGRPPEGARPVGPESAAYVMYTSGSTGRPKGVIVPHRAVIRLVRNTNYVELNASDRIAQVSNISFDAATFELWGALLNGGQLVGIATDVRLSPVDFGRELRERGITAMFLTAALFNELVRDVPGILAAVRTVIAGGEALDPRWVRKALQEQAPARLVNGYGPTENTTFTCCHWIREVTEEAVQVPIGKPISNTRVYVLDAQRRPVPIGVPGELYAGGDGLALGYLNRPVLDAEKFVPNPFCEGERLYRTGDRVRWREDGTLEFLGRLDDQVKIRGFRIEPGEIEAVINRHPAVRECVVVPRRGVEETKRLVAYLVCRRWRSSHDSQLRRFLQTVLPDYMVPSVFVRLPELPLTPNGKVDRLALPEPEPCRPLPKGGYAMPRDAIENKLSEIWEAVLGVRPIGIDDQFFELGGHSLLALRLLAEIEKAFGRKLPLASIFQAPTIEQLAGLLRNDEKTGGGTRQSSLVAVQSEGSQLPLYLVHGAGGGMFWGYVNLSRHLGKEQPVYGLKPQALDGAQEYQSITEMAAQYVADIRQRQPRGPYRLGGYCFGGNVAFEMARLLHQQGEEVALLALMNCAPPNSSYSRTQRSPRWLLRFARNLWVCTQSFVRLRRRQQLDFFCWKFRLLARRLRLGTRGRNPPPILARMETLVDLASYPAEQKRLWEMHLRALVEHQPRSFHCHVHLFRSRGHPLICSYAEDYGWGEFALDGVTVIRVPGSHERVLEEPAVAALAEALKRFLRSPFAAAEHALAVEESGSVPTLPAQKPLGALEPLPPQKSQRTIPAALPISPEWERQQLAYWREKLRGAPPLLELPADHPRSPRPGSASARQPLQFPLKLVAELDAMIAVEGATRFTALLGVFQMLLSRYARSTDIVVGTLMSQQDGKEYVIGGFENFAALRCDLSDNPTFRDLLARVRQAHLGAQANGQVSFARVVDELRPERQAAYSPVFQVLFELTMGRSQGEKGKGQGVNIFTSKLDLVLHLERGPSGLGGWFEYNPQLFAASRMARMAGHFQTLLEGTVLHPEARIGSFPLLSEPELRQLAQWNDTRLPYPPAATLAQLFERKAGERPGATALVCASERFTYRELNEHANRVAHHLRALGCGTGTLVGLCLERSWRLPVAMVGILKAGGAYLPLDPAYPKERLRFMLTDAAAPIVLTQESLRDCCATEHVRLVCLDSAWPEISSRSLENPVSDAQGSDLAYVIYTSGSTGKPKGVALEHRSAVAFIHWAGSVFNCADLDGVLASTSINFDLSVFEIFVPLAWGGKVVLASSALELKTLLSAGEVKLINTVPSVIRELLRLHAVPASVRIINLAGEPLPTSLVNQIYAETAVNRVYDLYGPTETTTYSTFALRRPEEPPTIGRPLANEQVFLLDSHLQQVPIGVPGEIFIAGSGLARGYLNRPELTAERFVENPSQPGLRMYRTGDLAQWRGDGQLEYLGRVDHQVKVRGFRIELGEIEAILRRHEAVREATVLAREDQPGDKRLVAYVVCAAAQPPEPEILRQFLKVTLPEYMLPSAFVFLERLPLNPNGKIDRKALPAPAADRANSSAPFIAPRNPLEARLAAIWQDVLRLPQVGVQDNFFDLGGHSLLAIQVLSRIRDQFRVELPLSSLFDAPMITTLAEGMATNRWQSDRFSLPPLSRIPRQELMPVSFMQEQLWFLEELEPGRHDYNVVLALRISGPLNVGHFRSALNALAQRHEALRTTFVYQDGQLFQKIRPPGPFALDTAEASGATRDERHADALTRLEAEAQKPFDLRQGPLARGLLLRLDLAEFAFVLVLHHTVSDGWSLAVFLRELGLIYDAIVSGNAPADLPELPLHCGDFAHWQRQAMQGVPLERDLAFWREQLAGAPRRVRLPVDREDTSPSHPGKRLTIEFSRTTTAAVAALGQNQACTPFMALMAALGITLHKWTGQEDLVLGMVVAGRNHRALEHVLGCFMNFLPVRLRLSRDETAGELLARVRTAVLEAQAHQDCPFDKIVEAINPKRRLARNPLYNVALLSQNFPAQLLASSHLRSEVLPLRTDAALLDLRFEAQQTAGSLSVSCEYRTDLFDDATVEALLDSLGSILERLAKAPATPLQQLALTRELIAQAEVPAGQTAALDNSLERLSSGLIRPGATTPSEGRTKGEDGEAAKDLSLTTHTIAVTATFTAEPIRESLLHWAGKLELPAAIEFAPYNQVFQQLLDPGSRLARNRRGLNVVLLRLEDWLSGNTGWEISLQRNLDDFVAALRAAAARPGAPYLVCICPPSPSTSRDETKRARLAQVETVLALETRNLAGAYYTGPDELATLYPLAEYHDPASEELGHVPYTDELFAALGTLVVRKLDAQGRAPAKVIALDCDQTLWRGVCGEDGPRGVCLDAPHAALQQFMKAQRQAGMLLVLCSKNYEEDVLEVFTQVPEMPLRVEHFAAHRLNWHPKSANLKALASELGLGLESFIFLDDNPIECAEVRANCPEVLTLQLPDPERIPEFLRHCWVFDHLKTTDEDRLRVERHRQNQQREQERAKASSLADFIEGLGLEVRIAPLQEGQLPRAAQLTQRTNQFNCTTRRRTEAELRELNDTHDIRTVEVTDRFGDYGLVGLLICRSAVPAFEVESFLLSCRVLGRGVEHRMLAALGALARERRLDFVDIRFRSSSRNQPAFEFLESLGSSTRHQYKGDGVYRFPTVVAERVIFVPAGLLCPPDVPKAGDAGDASRNGNGVETRSIIGRSERYQAIALAGGDVQASLAAMRTRTVPRTGNRPFEAPRTMREQQLCALWERLLRIKPVGIHNNFFELGGHSVLAVRLFAEIEKLAGRKHPLVTLFQAPTVAELARVLGNGHAPAPQSPLVPIQPRGKNPPLFLVHGAGGDVLWGYANLAVHMDPDQPLYGIKSRGQLGLEEFKRLSDTAAYYVEAIRAHQPRGPYYLGGYCLGGNVAYEMARQLTEGGETVGFLALLDSAPANAGYERMAWWRPGFPLGFARNLGYWLADFSALAPEERRRFVSRKSRVLGRKLLRRFRANGTSGAVDLEEVIDPLLFPQQELQLWRIHLQALQDHVEIPYRGQVHLFRTRGQPLFCSLAEDFCWGRLAKGGVTVTYVPGSHENIFMDENVRCFARALQSGLNQAHGANSPESQPEATSSVAVETDL